MAEPLEGPRGTPVPDARQRIVQAAYELFARRGIRDVGVDEVIGRAGVAKATLYRHFRSKDELVLAFLDRRDEIWVRDWLVVEAWRRGSNAEERLLAFFDVLDEWFHRGDYESCSFINALLEMGLAHPVGAASARHLENIRSVLRDLAKEDLLRDPDGFAHSYQLLMKGSVVAAAAGDLDAAGRAKSLALLLLDQHRGMER
ncbi:MAG TPA: TetR/AcrR family transcriptional regulator [Acidimicrobiales bacterium]|nr:TetR/AcrR family transcriptional regulator [Acidimicrobiales bacterium]